MSSYDSTVSLLQAHIYIFDIFVITDSVENEINILAKLFKHIVSHSPSIANNYAMQLETLR